MALGASCLFARRDSVDAQLTIYDVLDEFDRLALERPGMRRLGAGPELGMLLLQPLVARGWRLHRVPAFAGAHTWLFILRNGAFEVKREGNSLGDVAIELFEEAGKLTGAAACT
jgi:hypothetical protein